MSRRLLPLVILASLIAPPPAARAGQLGPPGGVRSNNPKDKLMEDKLRTTEIERVRRAAAKHESRTARDQNFPAIKEDFERMQLVNNALQEAASAGADYGRIAEGAAEIRKRAARLGASLFPPTGDRQQSSQTPSAAERAGDLKALLSELDGAIRGFVSNPMFGNTKVVNVPDESEARRYLERIIRLSGKAKQAADRLKKSNGK